jgi:thiamine pyrophosphate-dependent acetolactate synthase large subunit-like protein
MKRLECMQRLASLLDGEVITLTNLTTNASHWTAVWDKGPRFYGVHMGLCLPFACGLSLAFPGRQVVALEGDGSLMVDTSALITLAEVSPPNLLAIVFDNHSYSNMGDTATSRTADLAGMARAAGIERSHTVTSEDEFEGLVKDALGARAITFIVAKVDPGREPVKSDYYRTAGRPMKELFVEAIRKFPDYQGQ